MQMKLVVSFLWSVQNSNQPHAVRIIIVFKPTKEKWIILKEKKVQTRQTTPHKKVYSKKNRKYAITMTKVYWQQPTLVGDQYWCTRRGGSNDHHTLIHPSSQEREYNSNWPLGAQAPPRPTSKPDSASPDLWGRASPRPALRPQAPPRLTSGGGLRLARPLGEGSAL